jgi:hypothetical protein
MDFKEHITHTQKDIDKTKQIRITNERFFYRFYEYLEVERSYAEDQVCYITRSFMIYIGHLFF